MKYINAILNREIRIGKQGENEALTVRFPASDILTDYPDATFTVMIHRPGDRIDYPVDASVSGTNAEWLVSATDTFLAGHGSAQLIAKNGDQILKTSVYRTYVEASIGEHLGEPEGESWISKALDARDRAEDAADLAEEKADAILNLTADAETLPVGSGVDVELQDKGGTYNLHFMIPQGIQGEKGEKGDTGAQGPQGEQGEQGPQGVKGDQGDPGPQGIRGEKGPQGDKGETGAQGPQGEQGEHGERGSKIFHISAAVASAKDKDGKYIVVFLTSIPDGLSDGDSIIANDLYGLETALKNVLLTEVEFTGQTNYYRAYSWKSLKGDAGSDGNGIASTVLNDDYTLTITYTDGTSYTTPSIRGEKGENTTAEQVTSTDGNVQADIDSLQAASDELNEDLAQKQDKPQDSDLTLTLQASCVYSGSVKLDDAMHSYYFKCTKNHTYRISRASTTCTPRFAFAVCAGVPVQDTVLYNPSNGVHSNDFPKCCIVVNDNLYYDLTIKYGMSDEYCYVYLGSTTEETAIAANLTVTDLTTGEELLLDSEGYWMPTSVSSIGVTQKRIIGGDKWESGIAYAVNDTCIYKNTVYACILAHTSSDSILPTNATYWKVTSLAEINSNISSMFTLVKTISSTSQDSTSGAETTIGSFTLAAGTYMVNTQIQFMAASDSYQYLCLYNSSDSDAILAFATGIPSVAWFSACGSTVFTITSTQSVKANLLTYVKSRFTMSIYKIK